MWPFQGSFLVLDFSTNIEFLAWVGCPFCVEYSGESWIKINDHKLSYDNFYAIGFIVSISGIKLH